MGRCKFRSGRRTRCGGAIVYVTNDVRQRRGSAPAGCCNTHYEELLADNTQIKREYHYFAIEGQLIMGSV